VSYLVILVRHIASEAVHVSALNHRTVIRCSVAGYSTNSVGSHSQRHNLKLTISNTAIGEYRHVSFQCPYFSFEPDALMQISPGSVRTRSVSCTTPHNRRQVYTQYFLHLYPWNGCAPHLRRPHDRKVGPEHTKMKPHPYLACDRVYAVTGRNKLIVLCLSSLICAKTIISYYFISVSPINCKPRRIIFPRAQLMQDISYTTLRHPDFHV